MEDIEIRKNVGIPYTTLWTWKNAGIPKYKKKIYNLLQNLTKEEFEILIDEKKQSFTDFEKKVIDLFDNIMAIHQEYQILTKGKYINSHEYHISISLWLSDYNIFVRTYIKLFNIWHMLADTYMDKIFKLFNSDKLLKILGIYEKILLEIDKELFEYINYYSIINYYYQYDKKNLSFLASETGTFAFNYVTILGKTETQKILNKHFKNMKNEEKEKYLKASKIFKYFTNPYTDRKRIENFTNKITTIKYKYLHLLREKLTNY